MLDPEHVNVALMICGLIARSAGAWSAGVKLHAQFKCKYFEFTLRAGGDRGQDNPRLPK